jgi:hypothetical protein
MDGRGNRRGRGKHLPVTDHPLPYPPHVDRLERFTLPVLHAEFRESCGGSHPIRSPTPFLLEPFEMVPQETIKPRLPATRPTADRRARDIELSVIDYWCRFPVIDLFRTVLRPHHNASRPF